MIGRRGLAIAAVSAVAILAFVSLVPYPNAYDVTVSVTIEQIQAIVLSSYSITSVSGTTYGHSTLLDWHALTSGSVVFGSLSGAYQLQVCVAGHCASKDATKLLPSLPTNTGSTTNEITVGYVPGGQATILATLYQNGASVATGTGSLCVGC